MGDSKANQFMNLIDSKTELDIDVVQTLSIIQAKDPHMTVAKEISRIYMPFKFKNKPRADDTMTQVKQYHFKQQDQHGSLSGSIIITHYSLLN